MGLRVFGEYSLKVIEPQSLIVNLVGTQNLSTNDEITDWLREQLLKTLRTDVVSHVVSSGWPLPVRLSSYPELVEQEPNDEPAKANKLPVPGGISARFGTKGDVLRVELRGPSYETARFGTVPSLDAVATHDPESGDVTVFVVNRSQDDPADLAVGLAGFGIEIEAL